MLATQIKSELLASKSETTSQTEGANGAMYSAKKAHHPLLLQVASHSLILLAAYVVIMICHQTVLHSRLYFIIKNVKV